MNKPATDNAERIAKRWKRKKGKTAGEDFIARSLSWQVDRHKETLAKCENDLRVLDRCIEILEGYTYSAETGSASSLNTMFLDVGGVLRF